MVGTKLERRVDWKNFCKINDVVTMLNDMKDFCHLDLKCSVKCSSNMFEFACDPLHGLAG